MIVNRPVVWLERALLVFGCVCIGYYGYVTLDARQFQREQTAALEQRLTVSAGDRSSPLPENGQTTPAPTERTERKPVIGVAGPTPSAPPAALERRAPAAPVLNLAPGVLGILDIPRLRISSPVMSGDDDKTLDIAIGHLPDTPKPWESGNSAVAAHRDGLFRPLRHITVGDDLRVRTLHGELLYRVRELKIVMPEDLSVLEPTDTDLLTLITCFPFDYVGAAPKRFIVHAERVKN